MPDEPLYKNKWVDWKCSNGHEINILYFRTPYIAKNALFFYTLYNGVYTCIECHFYLRIMGGLGDE